MYIKEIKCIKLITFMPRKKIYQNIFFITFNHYNIQLKVDFTLEKNLYTFVTVVDTFYQGSRACDVMWTIAHHLNANTHHRAHQIICLNAQWTNGRPTDHSTESVSTSAYVGNTQFDWWFAPPAILIFIIKHLY